MDLSVTKQRLEQALGISFRLETLDDWHSSSGSYEEQGIVYFKADEQDGNIITLSADSHLLSRSERRLIEMIVQSDVKTARQASRPAPAANDEEGRARLLGEWISGKLEEGDLQSALPDAAFLRSFQYNSCLVMLLDAEFRESGQFNYKELKKLIDTYFESETLLVPISEREWAVLASGAILEAAGDDGEPGESVEELLESIALSLHEMIVEWIGECRISASGMLHAPANLLNAVANMRGAVQLGRVFHAEDAVHLPWKLHLERLLYMMDDREKKKFLEQLMKNAEHTTLDSEMMTTLQTFFQNDCNISETSKALYIHRNTLLYRLDKFKQATGMDVRNFHDAVLVHMALLLYKVTKWD